MKIKATIEFLSASPIKIVTKEFSSSTEAEKFLVSVKGSNYIGYLDDGTFAIYVGEKVDG